MNKIFTLITLCLAFGLNQFNLKAQTYATLPFIETFDNEWINKDDTREVPSFYWKNTPATGNNSWRRNDDGTSANWPSSPSYRPDGAHNSEYSARFHSSEANLSGVLDAFIDFSTQTGNKALSFWYINISGSDKLEVYISTDGGVTFGSALLTLAIQRTWEKVSFDLGNITTSTGVIRFKTIVDSDTRYNGLDIGLDNIRVGNPVEMPIDAYFTSDITSGQSPLTVNFTDKSDGVPTSWEWDFNNDGVVDATTQNPSFTYSSPGVYSVKLVAQNSNSSGEVILTNYIVVPGYAGLPYNQSFENEWMNRDDIRDAPDNFWKNNPATFYKFWSREDDGLFRGAWYSIYPYNPSGANGSLHSASIGSVKDKTGSIDLYVDFSSQPGEKRLTFWYINNGDNDKLDVSLSTDGGTTFGTPLISLDISRIWTKYTVNLGNITSATGVLRFEASTNGEDSYTSLGIDDVNVAVPALLPLKADYCANVISGNVPLTVNFTDKSDGAPTSWKWDFNNDGIVDATTQNVSYAYTSAGVYDVKLTVSKGGTDDAELKTKLILVTGYSSLPFYESFEKPWINRDDIKDVPSEFAKNTPATGSNSWSRDDEGVSRGAWYSSHGSYSPAGANGTKHSAMFVSNQTSLTGTLDFYLDFSTITGEKELKFWYNNVSNVDKVEIYFSTDGGTSFGSVLETLTTSGSWKKYVMSLGSSTSSTCILRFKAYGNSGSGGHISNLGIDEIQINTVEAGFNANITAGPSPLTVQFTDESSGNPTSWKWDFNNDGVVDATVQNPVYTYTSLGKYSVKLIASKTGSADSIVKTDYIVVKPIQFATLPFTENFENDWINLDDTRDVPSNHWCNTPATGNNS